MYVRILICATAVLLCVVSARGKMMPDKVADQENMKSLELMGEKSKLHSILKRAPTAKNNLTQTERVQLLQQHNSLRQTVSPPSSDMAMMFWSTELEVAAQLWANGCNFKHGQPSMPTVTLKPVGQNLWAGTGGYTAAGIVGAWFNENAFFDYTSNSCAATKTCGHYTQVAWSASYLVGCGIAFCPSIASTTMQNGYIAVCNYYTAGNYVGQKPYAQGTACSNCAPTLPSCSESLCAPSTACSPVTECQVTDNTNCLCDESFYYNAVTKASSAISISTNMLMMMISCPITIVLQWLAY